MTSDSSFGSGLDMGSFDPMGGDMGSFSLGDGSFSGAAGTGYGSFDVGSSENADDGGWFLDALFSVPIIGPLARGIENFAQTGNPFSAVGQGLFGGAQDVGRSVAGLFDGMSDLQTGGRSTNIETASDTAGPTDSDSGPTVGDTRAPAPPLTQPPSLTPQAPPPQTPAPVPETPLPASPIPTPEQAAQEQQAELDRVEAQAKEEERRRRAALRAYLNPTGPSGLRAKPLVGRVRLLGD
jgi:hypothetical protein